MSSLLKRNRFLIPRRITQVTLLLLFIGANFYGWKIIQGNYSAAYIFESFYLADPFAVLQMLAAGLILNIDVLIGALIILVLYGLLFGRSFCSWICPVNIVSDFAHFIRRKLQMNKVDEKMPFKRSTRYWILLLSLVVSAFSGVAAFEFVSPVSMLHRGIIFGFGFGIAAVFMVFLFDVFVLRNGWCGYICPLGAFYSFVSKFSFLRVNHIKDNCTMCGNCFSVCPEKQVLSIIDKQSGSIPNSECTICGRCVEVCDDDALHFGKFTKLK